MEKERTVIFKLVCKPPFTPRDAISVKQLKRSVLERFVSSLHQATQLSEKETIILWDGECQEHPDTIFAAMKEYCETGIQSLPFDDVKYNPDKTKAFVSLRVTYQADINWPGKHIRLTIST